MTVQPELFELMAGTKPVLHAGGMLLALLARPRLWTRAGTGHAQRVASEQGTTVQVLVAADGLVQSITPNAAAVLGAACERAAELGFTLEDVLQPVAPTLPGYLAEVLAGRSSPLLLDSRAADGGARWLELRGTQLAAGRALIEVRDVTSEADERRLREILGGALFASPDLVIVMNAGGTVEWVNPAFERTSGYTSAEVVGRSVEQLRSNRQRADFYDAMWRQLREGETFAAEVASPRADGSVYYEDIVITPVRSGNGEISHFIRIGRDVTGRRQLESEIQERAFYDELTGLPNERLLRERSKQILALVRRRGNTAALLHVDLRHLRGLNQTHGRAVGDAVLRTVADRLRQGLRESDTLARVGGDEFLVLLSEVAEEDSTARVVRRLRESMCRPFRIHEHSVTLDAHLGVALYPQDGTTFDELAECAELALTRAKQTGADYEFYARELSVLTQEKLSLEDDLRWAWEHDQFVLHYQPICATADGAVVGAEALARGELIGIEALARWPHTERGMMSPAHFIPLAERTGRIIALDRWAIATSAKQAASWSRTGWRGWVSVNLSARSLNDPDLPAYIDRTLRSLELDPQHLVIEITESTAMRDPTSTARVLQALKDVGVVIAVDDFGIGHSSLAYLKNFPVDLLKLDSSFIDDIGQDARNEQLLEVMIGLAHRIGARVVAEGVEREDQWEWLKRAGCDYIQGYLIGRPGPPEGLSPHS